MLRTFPFSLRRPLDPGPLLLLLLAQLLLWAAPSSSQVQRTVGFHMGQTRSHQLWSGPISTGGANGFAFGVNVDVPTPVRFFSIRAEIGYAGRGSVVWDGEVDPDALASARVKSHYLSLPVQGKVRFDLGPAAAYLLAGPTLDLLLKTQCTQDLCRVLSEENPTVFGVTVGSGVSAEYRDRFRGELEIRVTEGLTDAYLSSSSEVRYRSVEVLMRACFPF